MGVQSGKHSAKRGTNWLIPVIAGGILLVVVLPIIAAVAISQYQDYVIRTQVQEGVALVERVKAAVTEYYRKNNRLPATNVEAGVGEPQTISNDRVSRMDVANGEIRITYSSQAPMKANVKIDGASLLYTPSINGSSLQWRCHSDTLEQEWCPAGCQCNAASAPASDGVLAADPVAAPAAVAPGLAGDEIGIADVPTAVKDIAFEKYSVAVYGGRMVLPDFSGAQERFRDYRTRITEAARDGANFAGHFSVVMFGCGSGCGTGFVIDVKSGDVHDLGYGGEEQMYLNPEWRPDSRLLKVSYHGGDLCYREAAVWSDGQFKVIARQTRQATDYSDSCDWSDTTGNNVAVPADASVIAGEENPQNRQDADQAARTAEQQAMRESPEQARAQAEAARAEAEATRQALEQERQLQADAERRRQEQQALAEANRKAEEEQSSEPTPDEVYESRRGECMSGFLGSECRRRVREQLCAGHWSAAPAEGYRTCKRE